MEVTEGLEMEVIDPETKRFLADYLSKKELNRDFYQLLSEEQFDFREIDTPKRRSSSPREFLAHQIDVTRDYLDGVNFGDLKFGVHIKEREGKPLPSKDELLSDWELTEKELKQILSNPSIGEMKVKVPWADTPISAVFSLSGLAEHEVLHTGRNMGIMEHLDIDKYPSLVRYWGE